MLYKNKLFIMLIVVFLLNILFVGCNPLNSKDDNAEETIVEDIEKDFGQLVKDVDMRPTVIYYKDLDGYLVPVMREIPREEGIAKKTLSALVNSPAIRKEAARMGLYPVIPEGTEILGMSIQAEEGDLAKVDFSRDILNYNSVVEENILVNSIVYTLTEFPTINKVQFMIDGEIPDKLTYGTDVSKPLSRQNINLELANSNVDINNSSKVIVYYSRQGADDFAYFIPITRVVSAPTANMDTALNELLKGPKIQNGLNCSIPDNIRISAIQVKGGTAYISFGKKNEDNKETIMEEKALKSVMLTIKEFESIEKVKFVTDDDTIKLNFSGGTKDSIAIPTFANKY